VSKADKPIRQKAKRKSYSCPIKKTTKYGCAAFGFTFWSDIGWKRVFGAMWFNTHGTRKNLNWIVDPINFLQHIQSIGRSNMQMVFLYF
jgi:hypothetical protein